MVPLPLRPFEQKPDSTLTLFSRVTHHGDRIDFHFDLGGDPNELEKVVWPALKSRSERWKRDELWKTTCLELFIGRPDSKGYVEMNVSPSGDWALYSFDDYRIGMLPAKGEVSVLAGRTDRDHEFHVEGSLTCPGLFEWSDLVFGATAVIEYRTGEHEYWAILHAGHKPDFHLRASFIGRLQSPTGGPGTP